MSQILPAGTFRHPATGQPITLSEWDDTRARWWAPGALAAAALPAGFYVWPPRSDSAPLACGDAADRAEARDAADRALAAWLGFPALTSEGAAPRGNPAPSPSGAATPDGPGLDLDRLEALCRAATPGPWEAGKNGRIAMVVSRDFGPERLPRQFRADCGHFDQDYADAALIAEARTALPALIAEVRRLRSELDDVSERLGLAMAGEHEAQDERDAARAEAAAWRKAVEAGLAEMAHLRRIANPRNKSHGNVINGASRVVSSIRHALPAALAAKLEEK